MVVVSAIAVVTSQAAIVRAEGGANLMLPITMALAIAASATTPSTDGDIRPRQMTDPPPPPAQATGVLPSELHIPDGYALDDDRDPPAFAAPIDHDRLVSLDLLRRPHRGWMASLAVDGEYRRPMGSGGDVLRLVIEHRF